MAPDSPSAPANTDAPASRRDRWFYRHPLPIRITHWVNVVALTILLMSGLQIFNAHPSLYWGNKSLFDQPILAMNAMRTETGELRGVTVIFDHSFDTTGVFGASENASGELVARGFPAWATLPSARWLAMGRHWHFFFAWVFVINGLVYLLYSIFSRHLSRDLVPGRTELGGIGHSIRNHLLFRFPRGEAARHYNVLQKISYVVVVLVLLPLMLLAGLMMSPWFDAGYTPLLSLFDGRQSARTVHFIVAFLLVAFVLIHVFMVIVSGLWNNLRSMVTGRYRIPGSEGSHDAQA